MSRLTTPPANKLRAHKSSPYRTRILGRNRVVIAYKYWRVNYRWRQADANRCALNSWCYWTLRKLGKSTSRATAELKNQSVAFKNELLFQNGINFNDLATWQRRGTGLS